jgi:hypothetical protein
MLDHMTTGGWLFVVFAWGFIVSLNVYCFREIFKERKEDIVEPMPEIDKNDA